MKGDRSIDDFKFGTVIGHLPSDGTAEKGLMMQSLSQNHTRHERGE